MPDFLMVGVWGLILTCTIVVTSSALWPIVGTLWLNVISTV